MGCLKVHIKDACEHIGVTGRGVSSHLRVTASIVCSLAPVPEVRSCFGRGFWINALPWIDREGWKNNQ